MPQYKSVLQDASDTRQVNSILRNLRGEQFRHSRNTQRAPASLPAPFHVQNLPTLPIDLIYPPAEDHRQDTGTTPGRHFTRPVQIAGPNPPRSWTTAPSPKIKDLHTDSPAWREHALNIVFSSDVSGSRSIRGLRSGNIPTLMLLCLHIIRVECTSRERHFAEIMFYLPAHLRRVLARHSAINYPFSQVELNAIYGDEGHADGELIVVGPHAALRRDHLRRIHPSRELECQEYAVEAEGSTWDSFATQGNEPSELFSFILLSTPLTFALSDLPPTITCLALINITGPKPMALQRLPSYCPLVSLLDLSYNSWLSLVSGEKLLEDYPWTKLHHLKVLGLRGCHVTSTLLSKINKWNEIDIIH